MPRVALAPSAFVFAAGLWAAAGEARAQREPDGLGSMPAELAQPTDQSMGQRLQQALRRYGGDVYGCYDQALAAAPEIAGEVLVRIFVAPGGAVPRAEVLKDQVGSPALTGCLTKRMLAWKVPELASGETSQVVFPLVFKPDAARPAADEAPAEASPASAPRVAPRDPGPLRFVVPLSEGKPGPLGARARVEARVLVDATTVGPTSASLTQLVLAPTARLAPHSHPQVLEVLYVVKGLARVRGARKGELLVANAGDVIVVPPSGLHSIESAPLASLTLLQIFAPAGPEHAYRDPADRSGTVSARPNPLDRETDMPVVIKAGDPPVLPFAGGRGKVQLFLDGLPVGQGSLQRIEAEAGAEVPLHAHDRADELLFVLSGRGKMTVGGEVLSVGPSDAIHLPAAVPHALSVTERLVAIQCYAPGGPEQRWKKPATR